MAAASPSFSMSGVSGMNADFLYPFLDVHAVFNTVVGSELISQLVALLHLVLAAGRVPPPYPNAEQVVLWVSATALTLVSYYFLFGMRHRGRRMWLQKELRSAQERVSELEEKLVEADVLGQGDLKGKEVRIWMDGAFDMMHYGHMNAFRQGKALGTKLIVGVNSDKSITECKGAPVMKDDERLEAVRGCKFVDEVVPEVPYIMNEEYLEHVIRKYNIDYVVHGDDPCIVNGKDVYATAKAKGKYMTIPRTEGVSTTDIVGRMLLMSREHHEMRLDGEQEPRLASRRRGEMRGTIRSQFLTTSRMLRLFSAGVKAPPKGARVVYIDGAWDMFHSGHTLILKEAKRHGDYLIVGVFGDDVVNAQRGLNMPIMNLNERVLSVLGCGYADDVLIDAPPEVTKEMVASLGICKVMQGSTSDSSSDEESDKCYAVPKAMGIYQKLESPSRLTVKEIIGRIQKNQEAYEAKFTAKKRAEDEYYGRRYGLQDEADKLEPKVKSG